MDHTVQPGPDPQAFRDVMAEVCTPVAVITTTLDGIAHGTTVAAFMSLSLRPPMVVVALDRGSDLLAKVRLTRRFGINVLAMSQDQLAAQFAGKDGERFAGVTWSLVDGLPRLADAIGWLACKAERFLDGGDHVLIPAWVQTATAAPAPPLTYHRRVYGTHCGLVGASS
jgi:flavin reductase (DIM6/NTAB) family NADH-FMN oxidoreductase RutF